MWDLTNRRIGGSVVSSRKALEAKPIPNHLALGGLILVCCLIEFMLSLTDLGVVGPARLRRLAYEYGAFWPGLLGNWKPNYTLQPLLMFITYAFLHGGLLHLSVNMISLWSLGRAVVERAGQRAFALTYVAAGLGGALCMALLAQGPRPMVGASGALFGLVGAILAWDYIEQQAAREVRVHVVKVILVLTGLNLVLWWAMEGQLAWQAHLGGFIAGWFVALFIKRREPEQT